MELSFLEDRDSVLSESRHAHHGRVLLCECLLPILTPILAGIFSTLPPAVLALDLQRDGGWEVPDLCFLYTHGLALFTANWSVFTSMFLPNRNLAARKFTRLSTDNRGTSYQFGVHVFYCSFPCSLPKTVYWRVALLERW